MADRGLSHGGGGNASADLHRRAAADAKAEAIALIKLAETLGNKLREPRSKALGDGLFELRRNQVRLFYMFEPGQRIRLLGGMVKKQDRIPADVLAHMRDYQKDVRERVKRTKPEKKR